VTESWAAVMEAGRVGDAGHCERKEVGLAGPGLFSNLTSREACN
jgi:hypothetical protein